jgi:hypothetical protein
VAAEPNLKINNSAKDVKTVVATTPTAKGPQMNLDDELETLKRRLDEGDARMALLEEALLKNTELTQKVYDNTAGFVNFANDIQSGAHFMCRCAKAISWFVNDIVKPMWLPFVVVLSIYYYLTHDHTLPQSLSDVLKALGS